MKPLKQLKELPINKFNIFLCLNALLISSALLAMDLDELLDSLCINAAVGDLKGVRALIDVDVPINVKQKDLHGRTPLMFAACHGRMEVCQLLIDCKAQLHIRADTGWAPLTFAAFNGHKKVCQLFVDTMLKPIKKNQSAAIALLAIKKSGKSACMNWVDNHMIGLIVHQVFNAEKQMLFAQINEIKRDDMREHVLNYARQQLKMNQKTTPGTSHE
jgi:hypothetical protein